MSACSELMAFGAVAADGTILTDRACHRCSYNVRGLNVNGWCPECGTPIGISLYGGLLRYCDPVFVDKLRRGMKLTLIGIAAVVAYALFAVGATFTFRRVALELLQVLGPALSFLVWLPAFLGAWFLTEPDPSGLGEGEYGVSRRVVRVTLAISVAVQALAFIRMGLPATLTLLFAPADAASAVARVVGLFAELNYFSKLALRIPDPTISRRARFLMYALGLSDAVLVVFGTFVGMWGSPRTGGAIMVLGCVMTLPLLAAFVFAIMYLFLLNRMRRVFNEQAQYAHQIWAAVTMPSTTGPANAAAASQTPGVADSTDWVSKYR